MCCSGPPGLGGNCFSYTVVIAAVTGGGQFPSEASVSAISAWSTLHDNLRLRRQIVADSIPGYIHAHKVHQNDSIFMKFHYEQVE
jgi:hypothetical protein